mmetsp:Transcript_10181/g.13917  ORF Transcript_10181/g.13917 Transcript_10181/m.13917 type:complete len:378 (-) Transcript_10181:519-1652(-)
MSDITFSDHKIDLALEERRKREAERLARIKDPKLYNKVDVDALARQIAEKKAMKQAEAVYNSAVDKETLMMDQQLVYLEQERIRVEKEKLKALEEYRQTMQGKALSREFDLHDPHALRSEMPARISDDDERLGASSLQKFHGEDLAHSYRIKTQQDELRQWCSEAIAEKERAKADAAREDAEFSKSMLEIDMLKSSMEASARGARKATNTAVAEYNLALAHAKKERERAAQIAEVQDNVEEIQNNLSSTLLTEDPSVGHSFIAPNRLRPDHYKGMSVAEQQAILAEQAAQAALKAEKAAALKSQQAAVDAELEYLRQVRCQTEAQVNLKRSEMRKMVQEENRQLAEQQKATKQYLDKVVYPGKIEEHYFNQFNTTSR